MYIYINCSIPTNTYIHTYTNIYTYINMYTFIYIHIHIFMNININRPNVNMNIYMLIIYFQQMYTYIYIHIFMNINIIRPDVQEVLQAALERTSGDMDEEGKYPLPLFPTALPSSLTLLPYSLFPYP